MGTRWSKDSAEVEGGESERSPTQLEGRWAKGTEEKEDEDALEAGELLPLAWTRGDNFHIS